MNTYHLPYPPSANRYWRTYRNRVVKSAVATAYIRQVRDTNPSAPVSGEIAVTIDVYRPAKRGDLDNSLKIVLDSLIGIAYVDDNQIISIIARRHDDKKAGRAIVVVENA